MLYTFMRFLWVLVLSGFVIACSDSTPEATAPAIEDPASTIIETEAADVAGAAVVQENLEPAQSVESETLPYAEIDDALVYGHLAFPSDMIDPLPGIILIHERWGLDDGMRALADRIAGEGYVVLAVDLYGGEVTRDPVDANRLMQGVVENPDSAIENIDRAYEFLRVSVQPPSVGTIGWSFGGGWALNAAMVLPEKLDAVVVYYGQVPASEERLAPLQASVLGLFAENDRAVSTESVSRFEEAMTTLDKDVEITVYPGVRHGFADPESATYDSEAAAEAWEQMKVFLADALNSD